MNTKIETRLVTTSEELQQVQNLEKSIWGSDVVPIHQTLTAIQNGGLILGAYLEEKLVGFSYGFAGFEKGKVYLCSHILGIDAEFREQKIGERLKQEQKEYARILGYDMLTWTYDPLETRNAYLNLTKLRAICTTYKENCYGDMDDELNRGIPTDRFKVEWWINSTHVENQITSNAEIAKDYWKWELTEAGLPKLISAEAGFNYMMDNQTPVLVPAPANFQELKSINRELAIDWRFKTRSIFQTLFERGYAAVSLVKSEAGPVHHYLLVPRETVIT